MTNKERLEMLNAALSDLESRGLLEDVISAQFGLHEDMPFIHLRNQAFYELCAGRTVSTSESASKVHLKSVLYGCEILTVEDAPRRTETRTIPAVSERLVVTQ